MELYTTPRIQCGGWDLNPRTARDRILSPAPLAELGYPREHPVDVVDTISVFLESSVKIRPDPPQELLHYILRLAIQYSDSPILSHNRSFSWNDWRSLRRHEVKRGKSAYKS